MAHSARSPGQQLLLSCRGGDRRTAKRHWCNSNLPRPGLAAAPLPVFISPRCACRGKRFPPLVVLEDSRYLHGRDRGRSSPRRRSPAHVRPIQSHGHRREWCSRRLRQQSHHRPPPSTPGSWGIPGSSRATSGQFFGAKCADSTDIDTFCIAARSRSSAGDRRTRGEHRSMSSGVRTGTGTSPHTRGTRRGDRPRRR